MKQWESYLATYTALEQPCCELSTQTKCIFGCCCQSTQLTLWKLIQTQHAYNSLSTTACETITVKRYATPIYFKQPLMQNSLDSVILTRCSSVIPCARCLAQLPRVSLEQHVLLSYGSVLSAVGCQPHSPVTSSVSWASSVTSQQVQDDFCCSTREPVFALSERVPLLAAEIKLLPNYTFTADAFAFTLTQVFLVAPCPPELKSPCCSGCGEKTFLGLALTLGDGLAQRVPVLM